MSVSRRMTSPEWPLTMPTAHPQLGKPSAVQTSHPAAGRHLELQVPFVLKDPSVFGNPAQHSRPDFVILLTWNAKTKSGTTGVGQCSVKSRFAA